jgi:hypothetical protein
VIDHPVCSFVTDSAIGKVCRGFLPLWAVFYRVGTGRYLVDPLLRCKEHLGPTVEVLARNQYETGYLERVIPMRYIDGKVVLDDDEQLGAAVRSAIERADHDEGSVLSVLYVADRQSTIQSIKETFERIGKGGGDLLYRREDPDATLTITFVVHPKGPIQVDYSEG